MTFATRDNLVRFTLHALVLGAVVLLLSQKTACTQPPPPAAKPNQAVPATDWYHWRGPEQNGVSREKNLPARFSLDPKAADSNLIWKVPVGCRSTPLVMNGRVYLINKAGDKEINEQERVMCLDANDGKTIWEYKFNVFHTDIVSVRLGWTNLAGDPETGNIYAHGTQGLFYCFDKDGKVLWSRSLTEEYGRISGYGGRVTSPTVDGDLVIIGLVNASWGDQGRGGNRFLAMDKKTGVPIWWASTGLPVKDTYYSCPVVAVINNQRLLISGGADGAVHAFKVRTGEKVWSYLFGAGAVNCSPVVQGSRVYIGHGEENLDSNHIGKVICLDAAKVKDGKPELVWKVDEIKAKFASPILHEGRLYIPDDNASLFCLDADKGTTIWEYSYGTDCKGSPVWADGKIYLAEVNSKFHILEPGKTECKHLHSQFFRSPDGKTKVEINGSPAVVNGRIYFSTSFETVCIGLKDQKPIPAPISEPVKEGYGKYAYVQVIPADVVLQPGESVQFKLRYFDSNGVSLDGKNLLGQTDWSLAPMGLPAGVPAPPAGQGPPPLKGEITPDGKLTVDKMLPGQFGLVVAKMGNLTGTARVRVVSPLPIKQDFEKVPVGRTPGGWVNCQGKFTVQKKGDTMVLVKVATNASPLVARANAYIGMPNLTDYIIQADLMGTKKGDDRPDMGIVANRYTLMLAGNTQSLRLLSWEALPRVEKSMAFPWQPDVWYRGKLTVEVRKDDAVIRGKVWPANMPEPKDWTIEVTDPTPNREGSPALYGYATGIREKEPGTEIYYDNVSVTPNGK